MKKIRVANLMDDERRDVKRALVYLRVSTKEQAMRSGDPEGYSLPTQREACLRKAQSLGAVVVEEYLDKDTGTLVDKRPAMQRLLAYVEEHRDIDYVIVHKLDRLARNRFDDAHMTVTLEAAGATLVSCLEGIDQSPSGRLLQGMLASVNEYYSRNLSDEIKRKTLAKAKNGGTPFRAPIGYLNKQDLSGGKDLRWVELDPERAPLIAWAFEAYATGDWSLSSLQAELTARGLLTRPTARRPAKPLQESVLQRILTNSYYMGQVNWRGVQYEGTHPRLVVPETFFKVQEVLTAHNKAGERSWRHQHYLKGSVFCSVCESRLCLDFATGNGGRYAYFVCLGRKRGVACTQKALGVEAVVDALERHWWTVRVSERSKAGIRRVLDDDLDTERAEAEVEQKTQQRLIQRFEDEKHKLLEGYYAGAIPVELMKSEQQRIGRGLAEANRRLKRLEGTFDRIEEIITKAVAWVDQLHAAYQAADESVRRLLNQAAFKRVFVGPEGVTRVEYTEGFAALLDEGEEEESTSPQEGPVTVEAVADETGGVVVVSTAQEHDLNDIRPGQMTGPYLRRSRANGWNVMRLVEPIGLEPTTSCLQSRRSTS